MLLSRLKNGSPEIFATVQGEGAPVGVPAVFVRLSECNLRCSWCDTKYTWDWSTYDRSEETVELGVAEIVERVRTLAGDGIRTVVLTGGEPLLQQDDLADLAALLRAAGFRVEIETNGTLQPKPALFEQVDQWNVSPKLAGSGNGLKARQRPSVLHWFAEQDNAQLKFVVTSDEDVAEIGELTGALGVPSHRVIVSPEGTTPAVVIERSRWAAERCQTYGYRLGTRLHVFLWGSERGR